MSVSLRVMAEHRRRDAGPSHELPRLASVLAIPGFEHLQRFLAEYGVDVDQLQQIIDDIDAQVSDAARA